MTSPQTVLVPLDGSAHATAALPVARGFAELLHASMAVLHVSDDALAPTALVERMKLSGEDVHGCVIEQRSGAAAAAIVEEAGRRHAALIVMCPQIRTDLPSRALGSVAAAVLCAAPCPVVLVPPARGHESWALHRLLVPHDGTPTSAATMGPATDFAAMAAAELVVLHVATPEIEPPAEPGTLVSPRYVDQPQHEWPAWAQEFLDRLRAVGGARNGIDIRLAVARGDAGAAILDFARQSDLIVLGWRGVLEPDRARTMQRVIRDTVCPVIVFRLDHGCELGRSETVPDQSSALPEARWEHFPHDADIGVRGYGPTIAAAFEQTALALTAVVTDPAGIALRQSVSIACEAPSVELLLVDWLNAVVLRMATDDLVFGAFEVAISGTRLDGRALGEPIDVARHQPAVEVKGATLTALVVAEQPDGSWRAQCIVDV